MAVDIKIKEVWQKVEIAGFTGEIILGSYTITITDGIITAVDDGESPQA